MPSVDLSDALFIWNKHVESSFVSDSQLQQRNARSEAVCHWALLLALLALCVLQVSDIIAHVGH